MNLTVDIGNTTIAFGIFEGDSLKETWKFSTFLNLTTEIFLELLSEEFIKRAIDPLSIQKSIIGSVVPSLTYLIESVIKGMTKKKCQIANMDCFPDLIFKVESPQEIGVDRLCNATAAFKLLKKAVIIIDLGTATTFDVVSSKCEFLGGVITPGLELSFQALFSKTSKLAEVELKKPKSIIGKNTEQCLQSGIIFGYSGMVDSIVDKIFDELGYSTDIIATGGLAHFIQENSRTIDNVLPNLTLQGLNMVLL